MAVERSLSDLTPRHGEGTEETEINYAMQIFRNLNQLPDFNNTVITIGTFDGVHIGHQKLLTRINDIARTIGGESILITFHPHPRMVVKQDHKVLLLTLLEEKFRLLEKIGIDHVVVVPFTREFSSQSPEAYVTDFLVQNFHPAKIVIGYDHKFGKNRGGSIDLLHSMADELNFQVEEISKQQVEDIGVSSTKIRKALMEGDVQHANSLLGYEYQVSGVVVKGQQLGKTIGFPTANVQVGDVHKLIPSNGVYAVRVEARGKLYNGMMNIGLRPTVSKDLLTKTIEVNIFDFDKNIYGETVEIRFVHYIREERKFGGVEELKGQLGKDRLRAMELL